MADLRPPRSGDDSAFEQGAQRIRERAEQSARRRAQYERELARSKADTTKAFEDAVKRETAAERVRAKAIGETELVSRESARAIRRESTEVQRNTEVMQRNAAARRRAAEASRLRVEPSGTAKGGHIITTGFEQGAGRYRVPGTGVYKTEEAALRRMEDMRAKLLREARAAQVAPLRPRASAGGGARGVLEHIGLGERQASAQAAVRASMAHADELLNEAKRRQVRASAAGPSSAAGEQSATTAVRGKANQAKRAAEYLERQNEAMRAASGAASGERLAAEIIERKALAAERAVTALREQNKLMRSNAANAAGAGGPPQLILPAGVASPAAANAGAAATTRQASSSRAAAAEAERHGKVQAYVAGHTKNLAVAEEESRQAFRRATAQLGALDQGLQKHGYLTSEFIRRAAQGEASTKEWGEQILGTAAKFGAWTAVSIPVFAVLDGIRLIGQGAVQSASGVNELQRYINNLDTNKARRQLRELAFENNVPIEDAVTAMAQAGRLRQNAGSQDKAFGTARASLLLAKVGDLEPEQASKYTNAIAQGFGYQSSQLVTVVNQLNQAQNNFNLSIRDGASGIARAAGAWRAAGGHFTPLLRLFTIAQQATTASGEEIGTAFRRSAGFMQRPHNRELLAGYGIDASRGADKVYEQALRLVGSGQVKGPDILKLATALSSPQLAASVIAPTLQKYALYQQTADPKLGVTPDAANRGKGSAVKERDTQLASLQERIARIGHDLEQLGSNLQQSGFLDPLLTMAVTLDHSLRILNSFLDIWGDLPPAIQHSLGLMLEFVAAIKLARRFNIGESLAARAPGLERAGVAGLFRQRPDVQVQRYVKAGLRDSLEFLRDESSRSSIRAGSAAAAVLSLQERRTLARQRGAPQEEVARLDAAWEKARDRSEEVAQETEVLRAELAKVEADVAAFGLAMREGASAIKFATERGLFIPPTLHRPTSAEVIPAHTLASFAGGSVAVDEAARQAAPGSRTRIIPGPNGQAVVLTQQQEKLSAAQREVNAQVERTANGWRITQRGAAQAEQTIGRATAVMGRVRGAFVGLAARSAALGSGLLALFGPEFLIFMAAIEVIPRLYNAAKDNAAQHQATRRRLAATPGDASAYRKRQREAQRVLDEQQHPSLLRRIANALPSSTGVVSGSVVGPSGDNDETRAAEGVLRDRFGVGFIKDIEDARDRSVQLASSRADIERIQADAAKKLRQSYEALHPKEHDNAARVREALAANRRAGVGIFSTAAEQRDELGRESAGHLANRAKDNAAQMEREGTTQARIEYALRIAAGAREQAARATSPNERREFQETADQAQNSAIEAITKGLQDDLKLATTEGQRRDAFRRATARAHGLTSEARQAVRADRGDAASAQRQIDAGEAERRKHRDELRRADRFEGGLGGGPLGGNLPTGGRAAAQAAVDADNRRLARLRKRRDAARKAEGEDSKTVRNLERQEALLRQDLAQQNVEDFQAGLEATVGLANARDRDPVSAAQRNLRKWHRIVARARKLGLKGRQLTQLLAQEEEAANEAADAQLTEIESDTRLAAARAGTDRGEYLANRAGLQRELNAAKHPRSGHVDPTKVKDLTAQLLELDKGERQRRTQDAADAINARYDFLESAMDPSDTVALAKMEEQRAKAVLKAGGFKTNADRQRAQANVRRTHVARVQAQQNEHVDHLDFLVSIGKLTTDQEVASLQRYLKTVKNNKALRERIQRTIYGLQHGDKGQTEYDVNPANIRLPTITELRRTVAGGARGVTQQNSTTVQITVNGPQDYDRMGQVIERATKGRLNGLARAAGGR